MRMRGRAGDSVGDCVGVKILDVNAWVIPCHAVFAWTRLFLAIDIPIRLAIDIPICLLFPRH